jgi:hypothetical protein
MSTSGWALKTGHNLFLFRCVDINFKDEKIYQFEQNEEHRKSRGVIGEELRSISNTSGKNITKFSDIVSATNKDLCLESFSSKPDFKFQVHLVTTNREYGLFCRSKKERSVLVAELNRAIKT